MVNRMPVEETENFVHVRVRDPSLYDTCRMTDFNGKLPRGVKANYCKRKDNGTWETESYVFSKIDWTKEKAVAWADQHKPAAQSLGQACFAYAARFEPQIVEGKRFVKVWNLDTSTCNNAWGVTQEAQDEALGTFVSEHNVLLGPPGLSGEHVQVTDPKLPHYGEWSVIGHPASWEKQGDTLYGIYEVTVDAAWDKIQDGTLKATSPSVLILNAHYDEDGALKLDKFAWDHTLFVDTPAFPKSGVVATCEGPNPNTCFMPGFGEALQAAYHRQDSTESRLPYSPKGRQGDQTESQGGVLLENSPKPASVEIFDPELETHELYVEAAALTSQQRQHLRASQFAYVDSDGKGYLPINDESHVRAALNAAKNWSYRGQTLSIPESARSSVIRKVCAAARKFSIESDLCKGQGLEGTQTMNEDKDGLKQGCDTCDKLKVAQAEVTSLKELQGKYSELLTWQKDVVQAELQSNAEAVASLEIRAGRLEQAKVAERIEALKKIGIVGLKAMQASMTPLVEALEQERPLKSEYSETQAADTEEQVRQAMFGYKRDAKTIDKSTGLGTIIG